MSLVLRFSTIAFYTVITLSLLTMGCIDVGQERVVLPLRASGTATTAFEGRDGFVIELTRADVAIGPLYLCAAEMAGDLCEIAAAEHTGSFRVNALDETIIDVGQLDASTGSVRSYMHDYGISWLLTQIKPIASPAAVSLGGHSVVLAGTASREDTRIEFLAEVDIEPNREGVIVVRSTMPEHHITGDSADSLHLVVDARPWLSRVQWESFLDDEGNPPTEPVRFAAGEQPYRAVVTEMTAGARPTLTWKP